MGVFLNPTGLNLEITVSLLLPRLQAIGSKLSQLYCNAPMPWGGVYGLGLYDKVRCRITGREVFFSEKINLRGLGFFLLKLFFSRFNLPNASFGFRKIFRHRTSQLADSLAHFSTYIIVGLVGL